MNRRIRALVALLTLNCGVVVGDAHYLFDFAFYRVSGASITHTTDMEVPPILAQPVSCNFARVPVTEIIEFLVEIYRLKIEVPPGLIAPWVPTKEERLIASGQPPRPLPATPPGYVTHGFVDHIEMNNVPLGQGLAAMLHPLGLGYVVEDDVVRVCKLEDSKPAANVSVYQPAPELTVFDSGALSIAGRYVPLGDAMYPTRVLEPTREIALLGGPSVSAYPGTTARIDMRDAAPVEYFEKAPGGTSMFMRRLADAPTGMGIALDIGNAINGSVPSAFSLNASFVTDREPADGTALNVGKPRFLKMARNGKLSLGLNKFSAILTQFGDNSSDVLLAFVRVIEVSPPEVVAIPGGSMSQYTLETTFFQVRGEPNWEWWMRPYERAYQIYEGAGRVIGPVSVSAFENASSKKIDWAKLGMRQVKQTEVLSNPRVTGLIDHKKLIQQGIVDIRGKLILTDKNTGRGDRQNVIGTSESAFEHLEEMYEGFTGRQRTFTSEDLEGKTVIADISQAYKQEAGRVKPITEGVAVFGEVRSTSIQDQFSIQELFLARDLRLGVLEKKQQPESDFFRVELRCETDMTDGLSNAFLLPIAGDEFLIVLNEFNLVKE